MIKISIRQYLTIKEYSYSHGEINPKKGYNVDESKSLEVWNGQLEVPVPKIGDYFYINEKDIEIKAEKIVRNTDGSYIVYTTISDDRFAKHEITDEMNEMVKKYKETYHKYNNPELTDFIENSRREVIYSIDESLYKTMYDNNVTIDSYSLLMHDYRLKHAEYLDISDLIDFNFIKFDISITSLIKIKEEIDKINKKEAVHINIGHFFKSSVKEKVVQKIENITDVKLEITENMYSYGDYCYNVHYPEIKEKSNQHITKDVQSEDEFWWQKFFKNKRRKHD